MRVRQNNPFWVNKMSKANQTDLELKALNSFIGTQEYHRVFPNGTVTDGIKYIMENGYSWVVTDALSVIVTGPLKDQEFLAIKLKQKDKEADLIITDGNEKTFYKQHYDYTDAKRDLTLFYENGVLLLASEH